MLTSAQHAAAAACFASDPKSLEGIFNGGLIAKIKALLAQYGGNIESVLQELIAAGIIPAAYAPFVELVIAFLAKQTPAA